MSTRASYTFREKRERNEIRPKEYHVYKHHDGYPTGACGFISNALLFAWPLPRFEADEFACAFIAANKNEAGFIRLAKEWNSWGWLEWHYLITAEGEDLIVEITPVRDDFMGAPIWKGTIQDFCANAAKIEESYNSAEDDE